MLETGGMSSKQSDLWLHQKKKEIGRRADPPVKYN